MKAGSIAECASNCMGSLPRCGKCHSAKRGEPPSSVHRIASKEEPMEALPIKIGSQVATLALLSGLLIAFGQAPAHSADVPKKGVTPYVTHFIFRPLQTVALESLGN